MEDILFLIFYKKKIVEMVEHYHNGTLDELISDGKIPKNILLYGSSGTGKTLLLAERTAQNENQLL